jgi:DivIVA domain-containing protein
MERDRIERRDFSTARRGYNKDEVRAHLRAIADDVERQELRQRSSETLADPAADQIREILAAAERSAADIRRRAEENAAISERESTAQARDIRQRAEAEAAEYVRRVKEAADGLLEQAAAAEAELERVLAGLRGEAGSLVDGMKGSVKSVRAELRRIEAALPALEGTPDPSATSPTEASAAEGRVVAGPEAEVEVIGEQEEELPAGETPDEFEVENGEPSAEAEADSTPAPATDDVAAAEPPEEERPGAEREPEPGGTALAGSEGARLIALNMALNGTPREETARYLTDNFDVEDQEAILDDVYQRAG